MSTATQATDPPVNSTASAAPAALASSPPGGVVGSVHLTPWGVLALLLGALSMVAVLMLWQKVSGMQAQLAQQSAQSSAQAQEARSLAKEALTTVQDTHARMAVLEVRLGEVALQRSQLDELMQSLSRSRDENLVVDIEASLRLAQQQAQLTGSVEPLLAALRTADQRISRAAQPRLGLLQRAIARDIDRVKSSTFVDTPSLLLRLDELVRMVDELSTSNALAPTRQAGPAPQVVAEGLPSWWRKALTLVTQEARDLVRVGTLSHPDAVLLNPEQTFFLRENLKLKLLNARLGVLARQFEPALADVLAAQASVRKYFDPQSKRTQSALSLLGQLQQQMYAVQLPRIDDTLSVLTTSAAGR